MCTKVAASPRSEGLAGKFLSGHVARRTRQQLQKEETSAYSVPSAAGVVDTEQVLDSSVCNFCMEPAMHIQLSC
jgi:hypothetical protein